MASVKESLLVCFFFGDDRDRGDGNAIGCWMPAISAGICPMPITLTLLSLFVFNFGLYQTAPIFIATITSYTLVCGSGLFGALAARATAQAQADNMNQSPVKDELQSTLRPSEVVYEANRLYGRPQV